jgi:hypothetical protein
MQLRMDKKDAIPIREWEEFLAIARRAGASDDTMIEDEVYESDPDIQIGYKIDVEHAGKRSSSGPDSVAVPAEILHGLLFITRQVASSDGDVRGLEAPAQRIIAEFNEHFLTPVLGPNPYAEGERDIAESIDGQRGDGDA